MSHCEGKDHTCRISPKCANVFQTLDELDFERGIWAAAQSGDFERVKVLLGKGEDVNVRDLAGYTALHYAARNGHFAVCEYLLSYGAHVNGTTKAGCATALHRACSAGKFDIVKLLLKHNADVTMKDLDGKTALHRAAEKQETKICEYLVSVKSQLKNDKDAKGLIPADYAKCKILEELLKS